MENQTNEQRLQLIKVQKEISERDAIIGKCERKIYTLKKRTQELEKFKFVLDYKIKELKDQVNPRLKDIEKLKEQTNKSDRNLREFNKTNAKLGYLIDTLRMKQTSLQKSIKQTKIKI